jgi:predicted transcriptional regulator
MDNTTRIKTSIAKNPTATDYTIAKNLNITVGAVAVVRSRIKESPVKVFTGVSLKGKNVLPRKPAESASKFIRKLAPGRGFDIRELSKEWGIGEDTVRRHAKDMGCLKYVEVEPDEWVPVVMNPETAKQYV